MQTDHNHHKHCDRSAIITTLIVVICSFSNAVRKRSNGTDDAIAASVLASAQAAALVAVLLSIIVFDSSTSCHYKLKCFQQTVIG